MKQKHVLRAAQKYASIVVPFLYMGLGVFIIIKSECYPWSIERIDDANPSHPGKTITAVTSTFFILASTGAMLWYKLRKNAARPPPRGWGFGSRVLGDGPCCVPRAEAGSKQGTRSFELVRDWQGLSRCRKWISQQSKLTNHGSGKAVNATGAAGTGAGETDVPGAARQRVVEAPSNGVQKTEPSTSGGGQ
ncbi:hypothetical protein GGTG_02194 [Gaeumannomyces tritici R3-111a-1]|uniref:Uncharacterized protein n=1 Tax=Gaeumannomyces tritici (strain R3-111a-1) TaxID=644352 RepID=J3NLP4_GAET3|nr:hypothetical protein GGTG_02194 [Gaeumannomyces tritici R3-111a-1]EJT82220.1 hypothetical protein GGTG_02194 [Gaeumannomyces tritici R3-111a-1]